MKRVIYVVFLSILWLLLCLPPALAQHATGPRMVIEERFFNAQQVKEGEIIEHTFTVHNKGDGILEINKVSPG
jgi:uncharacterized protein (DUF58 family)